MNCVCEIISVGTELLLGSIVNTDAQIIAQGLSDAGISCFTHTTVGDNPERLTAALQIARRRAGIIITTGGLGPTCDDLTKQTVCSEFGISLVHHEASWERIKEYFARIGRDVTENNAQQALLPENGTILENNCGTAPGCGFISSDGVRVYMLPGPPDECRAVFQNSLLPILKDLSQQTFVSRNIRVFGIGEAETEDKLRDLMKKSQNPTLAPYAGQGEVLLRITASGKNHHDAYELTRPLVDKVCKILGENVYGVDTGGLECVVKEQLEANQLSLATAESCTGGLISAKLTDIPGISSCFFGGVVAYNAKAKTEMLGVSGECIKKFGIVSLETASAMAKGIAQLMGAEIGLGVTGLAGPDGDGSETPVGTVCIALYDARNDSSRAVKKLFGTERERVRLMSSKSALNMVRLYLKELSSCDG
ncbi:MAG: competence/damage-inducible protein A [Oscillospiraceae bacterium]|nr:competence/damage-inducible protein A [Oscillospiraceae bacterium]